MDERISNFLEAIKTESLPTHQGREGSQGEDTRTGEEESGERGEQGETAGGNVEPTNIVRAVLLRRQTGEE